MKKIFGVQAEVNITADEDVVKGIGGGIKNGSIVVSDIIKELKPTIAASADKIFSRKLEEALKERPL